MDLRYCKYELLAHKLLAWATGERYDLATANEETCADGARQGQELDVPGLESTVQGTQMSGLLFMFEVGDIVCGNVWSGRMSLNIVALLDAHVGQWGSSRRNQWRAPISQGRNARSAKGTDRHLYHACHGISEGASSSHSRQEPRVARRSMLK